MAQTARQKGQAFQRKIKKFLKELGYVVHNQPLTGKLIRYEDKKTGEIKTQYVSQDNDIFGCDLVARKPLEVLWIQVSLDSKVAPREKEFRKYFNFRLPGEKIQLWIKTGRGKINIKELSLEQGFRDVGKIIRGKYYKLNGL